MYRTLRADVDAGVGRLTLARPDAGNAIDLELATELDTVTAAWANRDDLRVVVIRGDGPRFCVGGDLRAFAAQDDLPLHLTELTAHLHVAFARLARMQAIVVVGVHGSAAGAGFSLACSGDIVVAAASARFVLAYSAVGLTPDGSSTWYLPRVVGLRRALDLALTNRAIDATEAERLGVVSRVVADDALDDEVDAIVTALASGPASALAATKRLLRASGANPLEQQLELETEALAAAAGSPDGREGIAAFLAKRPPEFSGEA